LAEQVDCAAIEPPVVDEPAVAGHGDGGRVVGPPRAEHGAAVGAGVVFIEQGVVQDQLAALDDHGRAGRLRRCPVIAEPAVAQDQARIADQGATMGAGGHFDAPELERAGLVDHDLPAALEQRIDRCDQGARIVDALLATRAGCERRDHTHRVARDPDAVDLPHVVPVLQFDDMGIIARRQLGDRRLHAAELAGAAGLAGVQADTDGGGVAGVGKSADDAQDQGQTQAPAHLVERVGFHGCSSAV
jgi:hypothetical protein